MWDLECFGESTVWDLLFILFAFSMCCLFSICLCGTESWVGRNYQLDFTGFMYLFVPPFTQCGFSCLISQKGFLWCIFIGWTITFKFRDQPNLSGAESWVGRNDYVNWTSFTCVFDPFFNPCGLSCHLSIAWNKNFHL